MLRRALVTGATGFIGSRLSAALLARGVRVTALVRPGSDTRELRNVAGERTSGLELVFYPKATLPDILAKARPDIVFHLAARYLDHHTPEQVAELVQSNVLLTAQLLEAVSAARACGFIHTGTFWQHAAGASYSPNSLYAATKQAAADLIAYYCQRRGLRALSLMLYDVYGERDPRPKLLSLLFSAAQHATPLDMTPGQQRVELVHVDDVCAAYLHAADEMLTGGLPAQGEAYYVSSGSPRTLREVVELYARLLGQPLDIRWGGRPYRDGEVMQPWVGASLPGFRPRVELQDGLARVIAAQQQSV
jgi:nucleoside-diphosphate-sugar epimerase